MSDQPIKMNDQIGGKEAVPNVPVQPLGNDGPETMPGAEKQESESVPFEPEKEEQVIEKNMSIIHGQAPIKAKSVLAAPKTEVSLHAEDISKIEDAQGQVDKLVELAQHQDPFLAVKVANHLDNNYVLDELHDGLLEEKIRKILVEKGMLKEL